jgi:pimeloyl-ACP methyl ester carboxylesterase
LPDLTVGDCSVYYEDIGTGEPVLFLHSEFSRGIISFGGQIQPFIRSYRCLLPDFRGHGRTRSENREWSTPLIAEDMAGFITKMELGRVHLIGYGMGGGVALHLASKHPEMVSSIITIGCSGFADSESAGGYEPEALIKNGKTEFIELIKTIHMDAHGGDWQNFVRQSVLDRSRYPSITGDDWAKLNMPMLLIGGEKDPLASEENLLIVQALCPQAVIWIVPGGGRRPHMPTDQVKEVNERILSFLKSLH